MAANPARGELDITVPRFDANDVRTDRTYTFKLSMKGAIMAETAMKRPFREIAIVAVGGNYEAIQSVVWAALQRYHAAEFKTPESAGELVDDAGGVDQFFERLLAIFEVGDAPSITGGTEVGPPEAQTGTSSVSKSMPDAPV